MTDKEQQILQRCADRLTIKQVHSPERFLDEVTLFLHQLEAVLPQDKQQILNQIRDKETILASKKVLIVIAASANDYLSKPVDSERLLSLLRVWLYH